MTKENSAGGITAEHLRQYVERIERLEAEKKGISEDIRDVLASAKGDGFDVKAIRQIIKIRAMDKDDLYEQETLVDLYKQALGMI